MSWIFISLLSTFKQYQDGLAVAKFLSGLRLDVVTHIRGHILGANTVLSLSSTYARALRVSTGTSLGPLD